MRRRRQDRLRGVTPPSHGGTRQADLNHPCIHTTTARGTSKAPEVARVVAEETEQHLYRSA
jgi:hypothetical protein